MASTLEWTRKEGRVFISGRIDENAELDVLSEELPRGEVLPLCLVRDWVVFFLPLPELIEQSDDRLMIPRYFVASLLISPAHIRRFICVDIQT